MIPTHKDRSFNFSRVLYLLHTLIDAFYVDEMLLIISSYVLIIPN